VSLVTFFSEANIRHSDPSRSYTQGRRDGTMVSQGNAGQCPARALSPRAGFFSVNKRPNMKRSWPLAGIFSCLFSVCGFTRVLIKTVLKHWALFVLSLSGTRGRGECERRHMATPMQSKGFSDSVGGRARTGNRRFWAASRPNPAPEGAWERPRPGPPSICTDFQPGRPMLRQVREVFKTLL
jgi:hypothetical protein